MLLSGENLHCHACFNTRRSSTRPSIARHPVTCSANGSSKQTTIHKLIDQQKTLLIPGVHDALSAKVLAHTGHVSAFVSGYAVSCARGMHMSRQSVCIAGNSLYKFKATRLSSLDLCRCRISIWQSDSGVNLSDLGDHHMQVSATLLGEPDVGLLTPPEMSRKTSQICMSIPQIPVIVDADTGRAVH